MKQLIFTLLTTFCLTTLPSASTPVVGLDDADVKSSAAHAAGIPVTAINQRTLCPAPALDFAEIRWPKGTKWPDARIAAIKKFLAAGGNVNEKSPTGETLLHVAANARDLPTTQFLITSGADLDAQDNEGSTPSHTAIFEPPVLIALAEAGADLETKTNFAGYTVLQHALNLHMYMGSPVIIPLIGATTQNIDEFIRTARTSIKMDPKNEKYLDFRRNILIGLMWREQHYQRKLDQKLASIQGVISGQPVAQPVDNFVPIPQKYHETSWLLRPIKKIAS